MVRKTFFVLLILMSFTVRFNFAVTGNGLKNPTALKSNKEGRNKILKLIKLMEIKDNGDSTYYFKYPENIQISMDDDIFLADEKQVLKFSPRGEFKRNFYKYGQGPSESISYPYFCINKNRLILHDCTQNKILLFDTNQGDLIREFKVEKLGNHRLLFVDDKEIYLTSTVYSETKGKLSINDIDLLLFSISYDGATLTDKLMFPLKYYHIKNGEQIFSSQQTRFLVCPRDKTSVIVSHSGEYQMKTVDLEKNTTAVFFSGDYKRVRVTEDTRKYTPGGGVENISIDGKNWHKMPVAEFHNDIMKLMRYQNFIWVITSTYTAQNLVLIDVFNLAGEYQDRFYLRCPGNIHPLRAERWLQTIAENKLYTVEEENGQKLIRIYQIGDFYESE